MLLKICTHCTHVHHILSYNMEQVIVSMVATYSNHLLRQHQVKWLRNSMKHPINQDGLEISFKTFFNQPIISWRWSFLDLRRLWFKKGWGKKQQDIGLFIPVLVSGKIFFYIFHCFSEVLLVFAYMEQDAIIMPQLI